MSEFVKIITHARRLKSALKPLEVSQLEEIKEKLEDIIEFRKDELKDQEREQADKLAKIAKVKELMEADGLALDDLQDVVGSTRKKRAPLPPKYEITVDGEYTSWTGQGRMPKVFKERIDAGASKEDFLIK